MLISQAKSIQLKCKASLFIATKAFPSNTLEKSLNMLIYGLKIFKHHSSSKCSKKGNLRIFYILEDDYDYLQWLSPKKYYTKSRIDLKSIKNISDCSTSFDSKIFKKFGKFADFSSYLFISYGSFFENKNLILKFEDESTKNSFWHGLQYLLLKAKDKESFFSDFRKNLAQKLFNKADKNGDKNLNFSEIKQILQKMHIEINQDFLKNVFKKYDKDKSKSIDWKEFQMIIDDVTLKPELEDVFRKYCKISGKNKSNEEKLDSLRISFYGFKEFLKKEQNQDISINEFRTLIHFLRLDKTQNYLAESPKLSPTNKISVLESSLSFSEFCTTLFAKTNEILDPEKTELYQEMDRPLTDYYINSSHNTYLMTNQITGDSNTKAYINALSKGCRCLELDCWEGFDGEPIIYHGYTLTSKILFRDVIQTIKDYAFQYNPYPVILSLENHCKEKQQDRMSQILFEILEENLYVLPQNFTEYQKYPSPNDLRYKILVKDKARLPELVSKSFQNYKVDWEALEKTNYFECDDTERYINNKDQNLQNLKKFSDLGKPSQDMMESTQKLINSTLSKTESREFIKIHNLSYYSHNKSYYSHNPYFNKKLDSQTDSNDDFQKKRNLTVEEMSKSCIKLEKPKIEESSKILQKRLSMFGIKMNLFIPRSIWNISSIKEVTFKNLVRNSEDKLQNFTSNFFLRVYPAGTRISSSNYDPIDCFNFGVQMIALNFQTADLPLLLYMTKFKENGGNKCGYVLKPEFMLPEKPINLKIFNKIRRILCIDVISGQNLRPEDENDVRNVLDPYVEVSLRGISCDEKENSKVYKSKVVQNNGFHPVFNLECQFKLCCPELAFIVFKVFDVEVGIRDTKIGWNAISLGMMRPGYRILPLLDSNLNQIEFSYLLCKTQFKDVVAE